MTRKNHFFRRLLRRRYDVLTETSFYRRLQEVVYRTSSVGRHDDIWFVVRRVAFLRRPEDVLKTSVFAVEVFCKKGALRNFTNFTGKHLCQSHFLNSVAGLTPATL